MEDWRTALYLTTTGELLVFENYEVSNCGTVRNKKTNKILSVSHTKNGYCLVHPSINSKIKKCCLHRLVLCSFTDNTNCSLQVNHKDENKENNCLNNLEWLTLQENHDYGTRNKRAGKANTNGKCSKPVLQYDKNGVFIREWSSTYEVQRQLGIAQNNICCCCNGKRKSAGGFIWRYKE